MRGVGRMICFLVRTDGLRAGHRNDAWAGRSLLMCRSLRYDPSIAIPAYSGCARQSHQSSMATPL